MTPPKPKPIFIRYVAKDFLDGTQVLEPMEELAYRRICDLLYVNNGKLLDDGGLAWATKTGDGWPVIRKSLLAKGKIRVVRGKVVVGRCATELRRVGVLRKLKKKASKVGVEKRKNAVKKRRLADTALSKENNDMLTTGSPDGQPCDQPDGLPNQEPVTSIVPITPPSSPEPAAIALAADVGGVVMGMLTEADSSWATRGGGLVRQWLADGADPETHIYPAIQQAIDRGQAGGISTLSYFTPAVRRLIAERPVAGPDPTRETPRGRALSLAQDRNDDAFEVELAMALRNSGTEAADLIGAAYLERTDVDEAACAGEGLV